VINALPIRTKDKTVIQVEMRDDRDRRKAAASEQLSLDETEALALQLLDLVEAYRA
jgi:hypothetical protein